MPQNVWCDAKDCIFYDDEWDECDVYRLKVEGGVCVGHPRSGRNVTDNDVVEKLKDENAKLRELVEMLYECPKAPECDECKQLNGDYACAYLLRELGFEVDDDA